MGQNPPPQTAAKKDVTLCKRFLQTSLKPKVNQEQRLGFLVSRGRKSRLRVRLTSG
jgi:hypothetical protein